MTQQMRQELDMPTLTNSKPFFSVIISCYNSRKYLPNLLNSLIVQDLEFEDLEVVLSDDCSTESYQDVVQKYEKLLNIRQTKTDYNYCPGNTRQRGSQAATGQWMIFSDHDDYFLPGALKQIMEQIKSKEEFDSILFTPFYKQTQNGEKQEMPINAGWTHGKIFNRENFWKKYNLHYPKDLTSHEDVALCTQLDYIRATYNLEYYVLTIPFYVWIENPNSLSNRKYVDESKERVFLDAFLIDYMDSTAGVGCDCYFNNNKKGADWAKFNLLNVIMYSYFYSEFALDNTPEYMKKNYDHIRYYLEIAKNEFGCTIEDIYYHFKYDDKQGYKVIAKMAISQTDIFVYDHSFREWLNWIWNEKY